MKKIILFTEIILISTNCFSQTKERVKINEIIEAFSYQLYSFIDPNFWPYPKCLDYAISFVVIPDFIHTPENYSCRKTLSAIEISKRKHVVISLNSGLTWELNNPPKRPLFCLFKRKKQETMDWYNFLAFKRECEMDGHDHFEKVSNIIADIEYITNENLRCLQVGYELRPDSEGKLKIVHKEIKYVNDTLAVPE